MNSLPRAASRIAGMVFLVAIVLLGATALRSTLTLPLAPGSKIPIAETNHPPAINGAQAPLARTIIKSTTVREHGHRYRITIISDPAKGFMHMEVQKQLLR